MKNEYLKFKRSEARFLLKKIRGKLNNMNNYIKKIRFNNGI